MGYGAIYSSTWWGQPQQDGWGSVYYAIANPARAWESVNTKWNQETNTYSQL